MKKFLTWLLAMSLILGITAFAYAQPQDAGSGSGEIPSAEAAESLSGTEETEETEAGTAEGSEAGPGARESFAAETAPENAEETGPGTAEETAPESSEETETGSSAETEPMTSAETEPESSEETAPSAETGPEITAAAAEYPGQIPIVDGKPDFPAEEPDPYLSSRSAAANGRKLLAAPSRGTAVKLDKALGCTTNIAEYLSRFEGTGETKYAYDARSGKTISYLGTPYMGTSNVGHDGLDSGFGPLGHGSTGPANNGTYVDEMQCGALVNWVIWACGGSTAPVSSGAGRTSANRASSWLNYVEHNNVEYYGPYMSVTDMLNSGLLTKGDIIYCQPTYDGGTSSRDRYGNRWDTHIGIFWGDTPGENKWWQSAHFIESVNSVTGRSDNALYGGTRPGKSISGEWYSTVLSSITPKSVSSYYIFKTSDQSKESRVQLVKTSGTPPITDGNSCYSFAGAVYGVFTSEEKARECYDRIMSGSALETALSAYAVDAFRITGNSGKSQVIDTFLQDFAEGTVLYTMEMARPSCGTYGWDRQSPSDRYPKLYSFAPKADTTVYVYVTDPPLADPMGVILVKRSAEALHIMPLAGAQYRVSYYDVTGYSPSSVPPASNLKRSWVLATDANGIIDLQSAVKISGDEFYTDGSVRLFPAGTYVIQEIQPPEGYLIDTSVYIGEVRPDGATGTVRGYNFPNTETVCSRETEKPLGSLTVKKYSDRGGTLSGAAFALYREAAADTAGAVQYNGRYYVKISEAVTGPDGSVSFTELESIRPAAYLLMETHSASGRNLLAEPIELTLPLRSADPVPGGGAYVKDGNTFHYYQLTVNAGDGQRFILPASGIGGGFMLTAAAAAALSACIYTTTERRRYEED